MKQELLLKAFGDLDDKYIAEASRPVPGDVSFGPGRNGSRKKRRTFALALAAALTIALGVSAYAGRVLFGWGGNMEIRASKTDRGVETNVYVHTENLTEPVSFEDGRMFFIVNDEHIDITDRVSETQPFIYQFADHAGVVHYWIVGKSTTALRSISIPRTKIGLPVMSPAQTTTKHRGSTGPGRSSALTFSMPTENIAKIA